MTPLFAARRAAEEFAKLVDQPVDTADARHAELLATVSLLREQTAVTPREEFVADLRSRLMVAADTALTPAPTEDASSTPLPLPPRRSSHRIGTAAAAALVVVGGTAGLAAAAQGALPGETLYPIKRGIESAATAFNTSDAGRGADLLGQAGTRLEEAEELAAEGASAAEVESVLADFAHQAGQGADLLFAAYVASGDTDDIRTVQDFTARSMGTLGSLAEDAPSGASASVEDAAQLLHDLDTQARTLCVACGGLELTGLSLPGTAGLNELITGPTLAAGALEQLRQQVGGLAEGAETAAGQTPDLTPGTTGADGQDGTSTTTDGDPPITQDGEVQVPTLPKAQIDREDVLTVTNPVKNTIKGTTDGVTGLIQEVTEATPLAPVTDPLVGTLDQTVDSVTDGLLP